MENINQGKQLNECNNANLPKLCHFNVKPFELKSGRTEGWHAEFIEIGFDNNTRYGFIRNSGVFLIFTD